MIDFSKFNSLLSLTDYFNTQEKCELAIIESRWGVESNQDVVCPYCGRHHCNRRRDGRFCCSNCKSNFSCLVGTIFENTKLPLKKWFMAMYLISSHKKGISSHQLARDIDVCQKTAWFMLQKIRTLYSNETTGEKLSGEIELDEVYIGGKEKWKHKNMRTPGTQGRSTKTKTPVFGMMERTTVLNSKGKIETMTIARAFVVNKTDATTLIPIIKANCEIGSHITTDELSSYNTLTKEGYTHDVVCHSKDEYVKGDGICTNDMEGFWSHFRRMMIGCYHNASDKYLQRYVDEACYRWNTRKESESYRFDVMFKKAIGICNYDNVKKVKTDIA